MVRNKKFFRKSERNFLPLSIEPFYKVQREVIYFPYVVIKNEKPSLIIKNCSIHGNNCEISGPNNFWTPVKSNMMFETETAGPCLVWKLQWGGHGPPSPLVATPLREAFFFNLFIKPLFVGETEITPLQQQKDDKKTYYSQHNAVFTNRLTFYSRKYFKSATLFFTNNFFLVWLGFSYLLWRYRCIRGKV